MKARGIAPNTTRRYFTTHHGNESAVGRVVVRTPERINAMTQQFKPVQPHEIRTPHLPSAVAQALLTTVNAVGMGLGEATVSLTYNKQTKTRPRIAGEDYVAMPGVSQESQTGTLTVHRKVDNAANRRNGTVGEVYLKVKSVTRADGVESFGYTNVRPEGITAFVVLGFKERDLEAEARAKAEREAQAEKAKAKADAQARADARLHSMLIDRAVLHGLSLVEAEDYATRGVAAARDSDLSKPFWPPQEG